MSRNFGFIRRSAVLLAAAAVFAGCGASGSNDAGSEPGTLVADVELPAPTGKTILKISGDVSESNSPKGIRLDRETLEEMPITEATIYEPFLKTEVTFSGVLMSDFLEIVGADPAAGGVEMTALDDFVADLPMSELTSGNVLLATRQGGDPLKLRAGGPSRIVFLDAEGVGSNTDMWIWSVDSMVVHP